MANALTSRIVRLNLSDYDGLNDSLSTAQGDVSARGGGTIVIDANFSVNDDVTVPAGVVLDPQGGMLTTTSGKTLTIDGTISPGIGLYQLFGGAGTVALGPGARAAHLPGVGWRQGRQQHR